jgi:hypothetical protein
MQRDKMLAIHTQEHASRSLFWQVRQNRPKPVAQAASATNIRKSGRTFLADKSGSHSIWRNESEPLK